MACFVAFLHWHWQNFSPIVYSDSQPGRYKILHQVSCFSHFPFLPLSFILKSNQAFPVAFVSFHVTAKSEEEAKEEDSTWTAMGHHIFFLTDDCGLGVFGASW